jgi:hypothetical protein
VCSWADVFPYVNGGLFSGSLDAPRFSKIARSYLLNVGGGTMSNSHPPASTAKLQLEVFKELG